MLKSWRNSAPKSVLSVIQSQCGYCSTGDDEDRRREARENRERMLRFRYEQKQLFGRIIRKSGDYTNAEAPQSTTIGQINVPRIRSDDAYDEAKIDPIDCPDDATKVPNIRLESPEKMSEFYWLSQRSHIKILKSNKSRPPNKGKSETESTPKKEASSPDTQSASSKPRTNSDRFEALDAHQPESQTTKLSPTSAIVSAKNLLQKFVLNRNSDTAIPFDEAGLKSLVGYPLVCKKRSTSQVQELLADVSLRLPSISKVLQATMPLPARIALRKWKLGKIEELGIDGFKQYEKATLDRGKTFHSAIEDFLSQGHEPAHDSPIIQLWQSIDSSLKQLKPKPVLLEQPILHADLKYKGIIDNVSIVENELCAFEWKTSEKSKPRLNSTYDAPVQLCAYLGALNADPRYDLTVKNGCVVVAYTNGDSANVFKLSEADLRKYWLMWLQRLQEYWIRVRDGTLPDPI